ncbi:FecR family protein [Dysgonomonas sp. BGC7]|uniref:FecR family protein n=1 Tax=Dysgonomonas sp. BGC7 TaxID=1658008 RepID=UPI00160AD2B5|nr:FecR family protein [Dysgonomonas sp. BGC7]MBD8390470.1 FecR family protein [Dysgonomonas sp. BGC7]
MEKNKNCKGKIHLNDEKDKSESNMNNKNEVLDENTRPGTLQDIWQRSSFDMDKDTRNQMFEEIRGQINWTPEVESTLYKTTKKSENRFRWIYIAVSVAASVILCVFAFHAGINHEAAISESEEVIFRVNNGQKAEVDLPDGTKVFLNSSSSLTYNKNYNKVDRKVKLEGEAYFKIAHNKQKPFVVQSKDLKVEALGTTFNVRSYDSDSMVAVVLVEGKVKVSNLSNELLLDPNERLHYDLVTSKMHKDIISPNSSSLLWLNNELDFYGEELHNICMMLHRMYDVNFIFSKEILKKEQFTGLIKNSSLENVLEVLSTTSRHRLKYKRVSGDTILIYN